MWTKIGKPLYSAANAIQPDYLEGKLLNTLREFNIKNTLCVSYQKKLSKIVTAYKGRMQKYFDAAYKFFSAISAKYNIITNKKNYDLKHLKNILQTSLPIIQYAVGHIVGTSLNCPGLNKNPMHRGLTNDLLIEM